MEDAHIDLEFFVGTMKQVNYSLKKIKPLLETAKNTGKGKLKTISMNRNT